MTPAPAGAPSSRARVGRVGVGAVVVATAIVAVGLAATTDRIDDAVPVPAPDTSVPEQGPDVLHDLTEGLPPGAEELAGGWAADGSGASVAAAASLPSNPLLSVPVEGPSWATVTVTGEMVEGWSVAFGITGPDDYWAVSVLPESGTVQLVQVVAGRGASLAARDLPEDGAAVIRLLFRGRQVQAEAAGVPLPTASVSPRAPFAVGLLGRGRATAPGVAHWTSIEVVADPPLAAADLPPLLGARHRDADEVRTELGG